MGILFDFLKLRKFYYSQYHIGLGGFHTKWHEPNMERQTLDGLIHREEDDVFQGSGVREMKCLSKGMNTQLYSKSGDLTCSLVTLVPKKTVHT